MVPMRSSATESPQSSSVSSQHQSAVAKLGDKRIGNVTEAASAGMCLYISTKKYCSLAAQACSGIHKFLRRFHKLVITGSQQLCMNFPVTLRDICDTRLSCFTATASLESATKSHSHEGPSKAP
eukprot:CAMPEP_0172740472 /NCGR_PEP_ID=MMETSP1074-20121228/124948_1 /TAXON_ID=2916 /ORGANISM="Ceratium fusus, Strain PA161109" /LENGTH=123 /DNA_ID=CAMNT_0013570593 /DNA_START=117 /DNA_END=485 /DNA_ORIENTATION=-